MTIPFERLPAGGFSIDLGAPLESALDNQERAP